MAESTYSQGHDRSVAEGHGSRNATNTCAYFTHLLEPHFNLLDVGCGPGSVSSSLARLLPKGQVVGLDASAQIIQTAKAQSNLPQNCTFAVGSAMRLPYDNDSFDVVHTSQVLCHVAEPVSAVQEFKRVCKPGGFLACREVDWDSMLLFPMTAGLSTWSRVSRENMRSGGAEPNAGRHLIHWALQAGCREEMVHFSHGHMLYTGKEREWWGNNMATRVSNDEVWRSKARERGLAADADFDSMRDGWLQFAGRRDSVNVVSCGQVVCYQ